LCGPGGRSRKLRTGPFQSDLHGRPVPRRVLCRHVSQTQSRRAERSDRPVTAVASGGPNRRTAAAKVGTSDVELYA
jgi:hypothetical protein